jgi:hypothetical protein
MTEELKKSIQNLYDTFDKYQGNPNMDGSPIYDDEIELWNQQLFSKPLRELSAQDLFRFHFKSMTTWGDENDFKHFLPRLMELETEFNGFTEIALLYNKLEYAQFKTWPVEEQSSVYEFTLALWISLLTDPATVAEWEFHQYFESIANIYPDTNLVLKIWEENNTFVSLKYLADYVLEKHTNIFRGDQKYQKYLKCLSPFKQWLLSANVIRKMEQAFFEFEKDPFAENFSWAEKILSNERKLLP